MQDIKIHPTAEVHTTEIGEGTCIWQYCVILGGSQIGKGCNINCHVFIENDVQVGNNVTVKSGVRLWDGIRLEDGVFVGPSATFTNDLMPRSGQRPAKFMETTVGQGASIGANATIIGNRTIGRYAMIGAGSVVTHDIPEHTLWYGNPARCYGYVCRCGQKLDAEMRCVQCGEKYPFEPFSPAGHKASKGIISSDCIIHKNVHIGKDVTIGPGVIIYDHVRIEDGTFIGSRCVLGERLMGYYRQGGVGYKNPPLVIGKNSIIRSHSVIYSGSEIGENFHTGHHATIREHSRIGRNCSLGTYGDIQGEVEIGDYCRFHSAVHIGQYSVIKNYVFIFPKCILTNDPHPPSDTCIQGVTLEDYSVICAGAVLMPGIKVGREGIVGASSLVTKDVAPESVVLGNPARPICTIHDIQCKEGKLKKPYPWRNHFKRGMPWE